MKQRTRGKHWQRSEIRNHLKNVWKTIPRTYVSDLVKSMPARCEAVIAQRGGHTKY